MYDKRGLYKHIVKYYNNTVCSIIPLLFLYIMQYHTTEWPIYRRSLMLIILLLLLPLLKRLTMTRGYDGYFAGQRCGGLYACRGRGMENRAGFDVHPFLRPEEYYTQFLRETLRWLTMIIWCELSRYTTTIILSSRGHYSCRFNKREK